MSLSGRLGVTGTGHNRIIQAQSRIIREVGTGIILHQLNPLIGDIEQSACSDIVNFDERQTRARIVQIKLQIEAITKLYNAAKPAGI